MDNHVTISITQNTVGISRLGFGTALVLSHTATFSGLTKSYASALEVADDFATDSPEYLAATALFSQSPRPKTMKIGKAPTAPTQKYNLIPTDNTDGVVYNLTVKGEGITDTDISYTVDSDTIAEIIDALDTAISAVVGNNYATTDNTTSLDVTGDAAGDWFSIEVEDPTLITIEQTHANPGVATDLNAIIVEDSDWYCLLTHFNSAAYVIAAATWVETNKKIYPVAMSETDIITETSTGSADTADDLKTSARARTKVSYHPDPSTMFAHAWAGKMLPKDPGSATWKFKQLSGPAAVSLTTTQRANLVAKNANSYEAVTSNLTVTFDGKTADGDFMDVQRGLDWLENDMQSRVMEVLAGNDKIGYDDDGIAVIAGAMEASLKAAVARRILADDDNLLVTRPELVDIDAADKTARTLPDMDFSGTLVGAIHKVEMTGTVSA